mmetsp:Transcript_2587/g.7150  ORF Transcript_2587/g.7150 Transcript_2587/m.7150 type:complete len:85 (+) Transcript_2587:130-384(+)
MASLKLMVYDLYIYPPVCVCLSSPFITASTKREGGLWPKRTCFLAHEEGLLSQWHRVGYGIWAVPNYMCTWRLRHTRCALHPML